MHGAQYVVTCLSVMSSKQKFSIRGQIYENKENNSKFGYFLFWLGLGSSGGWVKPGGALTLERGMGMCRGHDPLFSDQSPLPSLPVYRQCAALVPLVLNF